MTEQYSATSFDKSRGDAGLSEVEELIRQTLAETKKPEKTAEPASAPDKKDEFKATSFSAEPKPAPVAPPPLQPILSQPVAKATASKQPVVTAETSAYDATMKEYEPGDIVKGKVLKIDQSGILVDIKYKADGLIPIEELADRIPKNPEEIVKVGDVIDVLIEKLENKEGYALLSKKKADFEKGWKIANDAYHRRSLLAGKVLQALKGGLVVDCDGLRGFVPASQVAKKPEETLDSFVGQTIPLRVIEVNQRQGKIVLSHRQAAGEKEKLDSLKILEELEVGQVRKGKVSHLKPFGAFVDLGGIEGLIHLTELSWKRVKHPSEVVKPGEEIDVFILGVDRVNRKVSLGLKELLPDPWASAGDLYKPGQIVKAKVLRFAKFGAFAELERGLEGLIHISELSREPVQNPGDAVKIGETYDVKILRVLPAEQRIGLSIKEVLKMKEKAAAKAAAATPTVLAATTEEKKVTIADIIAEKERAKAEKEAAEAEAAAGTDELPPDA
ncbi:MAG: 30S ribosomal protein S1 [Candidatus Margulisbacteria bacterium]|jgi:4-hydroxy-3-methylbut-2-enyl diphosphate reductase|nr:30S ribosomal protein S1 [Candidatus Margulisiibacteriota bacterium]